MLKPKPAMLVDRPRKLVRHGVLTYYSPNTNSTKPRYFFLFNDCLLITKRKSASKYRLRVFVHLRSNIKLYDMKNQREFRLVVPTLRGNRNIIMFAQNAEHKRAWIRDLMHCLWVRGGRIGPDPSGITPYTGPVLSPAELERLRAEQLRRDEEEMRKMGHFFGDSDDEGGGAHGGHSRPLTHEPAKKPQGTNLNPHGGKGDYSVAPKSPRGGDGGVSPRGRNDEYTVASKSAAGAGAGAGAAGAGSSAAHAAFDPFSTGHGDNEPDLIGLSDFDPFADGKHDDTDWTLDASLGDTAAANAGGLDGWDAGGVDAGGADSAYDKNKLYGAGHDAANAMKGMLHGEAVAGAGAAGAGAGGAGGVGADGLTAEERALQEKIERESEQALRDAAAAIEEIARKLAARPRKAPAPADAPVTMDEVADALMGGAEAVARAAQALLVASTAAQAERLQMRGTGVDAGKYHTDPQWSNGLISAARQVVATTKYMVQCADDVAAGRAGFETLTASVHAVTAATTQLVTAQRAKADPSSEASKKLESAAKSISKATRTLVDQVNEIAAAQRAQAEPVKADSYDLSMDQVKEIQAQAKAIKLEEDARRAREELSQIRKQKYQN